MSLPEPKLKQKLAYMFVPMVLRMIVLESEKVKIRQFDQKNLDRNRAITYLML